MCLIFLWTTILRVPCTRQMWEHNLDWNNSVEPMVETALFIVGGFSLWSWCDIYYFSSHNNHFTTIFSAFFCSFFRYHFRPFIHWRWAHFEHIHISEIESRKMATNMTTGYLVINDCPIIVSRQQSQTYIRISTAFEMMKKVLNCFFGFFHACIVMKRVCVFGELIHFPSQS